MAFGNRKHPRTIVRRHTQTVVKIEIFPGVSKRNLKKLLFLSDVFKDICKPKPKKKTKKRKHK